MKTLLSLMLCFFLGRVYADGNTKPDPEPVARRYPDHDRFNAAGAVRLESMARRRPVVYEKLAEHLVQRFDLAKRRGIGIDIGSGTGELGVELAGQTEAFYWINTDINSWCMPYVAEKAAGRGLAHRTTFLFADACALPFKDAYADVVVSRGSYQFWPDLEQGLREIHRVLRPGGVAFIGRGLSPNMPEATARELRDAGVIGGPRYDPDQDAARFTALAQAIGLKDVEVLRHRPEDPDLNYGVWISFLK